MLSFMALDFYRTNPLLGYALFALGVFMVVFFVIVVRTVLSDKDRYADLALIPLRSEPGAHAQKVVVDRE